MEQPQPQDQVKDDTDLARNQLLAATPLEQLQAEFAVKAAAPRIFKRFPARSGRLAGEFRPINKKQLREGAAAEADEFLLAAALIKMMIEDKDHPQANERGLVPLGAWAGKADMDPIQLDHRLCEIIGIPKGTPEEIGLALFEDNDLRLAVVVGEIGDWSVETHNEAVQDFKIGSRKTS